MSRPLSWMILAVLLAGCQSSAPSVLSPVIVPPAEVNPRPGSSAWFDQAALAALAVEDQAKSYVDRVSFTRGMKLAAIKKASEALRKAEQSVNSNERESPRQPLPPNKMSPYHPGWRLIGRCWVWEIEAAIEAENWDLAARKAGVAIQFGWRLTGGDAADASLGLSMINEARAALAPHLSRMDRQALLIAVERCQAALRTAPALSITLGQERDRALMGIQFIQDQYVAKKTGEISTLFGRSVQPAVSHLSGKVSANQAPEYFRGFKADVEEMTEDWTDENAKPVAEMDRTDWLDAKNTRWKGKNRPWKLFMPHLMTGVMTYPGLRREAEARTKLLAISAASFARVKSNGSAPASIRAFPAEVRMDPFSLKELLYRAESTDFRVWSVGADGVDSGGNSDLPGRVPDLILERAAL